MTPHHSLSPDSPLSGIDKTPAWQRSAVIAALQGDFSLNRDELVKHLVSTGFTGILLEAGSPEIEQVSAAQAAGLTMLQAADLVSVPQATLIADQLTSIIEGDDITGEQMWAALVSRHHPNSCCWITVTDQGQRPRNALALMLLASLPITPVITIDPSFLALPRDQSELVRSVLFWRNRFKIGSLMPRLVHAGDDGTLLLITGTWLVALNWTAEEVSIDIGSTGSMWLMLATHRDVHLHGSQLILPRDSGAILANELAR